MKEKLKPNLQLELQRQRVNGFVTALAAKQIRNKGRPTVAVEQKGIKAGAGAGGWSSESESDSEWQSLSSLLARCMPGASYAMPNSYGALQQSSRNRHGLDSPESGSSF